MCRFTHTFFSCGHTAYDFSLQPSAACENAPSGGSCHSLTDLVPRAAAIAKRVISPTRCSTCYSGSTAQGSPDPFVTSIQPLTRLLQFHQKSLLGRMEAAANALGMKHLANKVKHLPQELTEDLEDNTNQTEQNAIIEAGNAISTLTHIAKAYGSCHQSQPSGAEMFKMVSFVVLKIKNLETVVNNLETQRDNKRDAFKRAILTKVGSLSQVSISTSTLCLTSCQRHSGLIIDDSFVMEDVGTRDGDLGSDCSERHPPSATVTAPDPCLKTVPSLYYPHVVLQRETASMSDQVCNHWICEFCGAECFCSSLND
ncbi:hypothetical protein AOQ84DRAFT_411714 [Glonium stellatum]|uniref:Uncharacterized protein n=1 Tax=Glonium stellatum TaxID=574774 RepID=A0A8E2EWR4_9PEZI|nr:hypothetical protein AOQ84DRAFT_411714 [Glonium stellatum]